MLLTGGGGRAKGFGGPDAPALKRALALGDGGGSSTPEECEASVLVLAGVTPVVPDSLGDESAVALPVSECSLGICTFNRGRFASVCMLFVRDGGGMLGTEDADAVLWGRLGSCCRGTG